MALAYMVTGLNASDTSKVMGVSKQRVASLLKALERKKVLTRKPGEIVIRLKELPT